jgi:hypothetical protein
MEVELDIDDSRGGWRADEQDVVMRTTLDIDDDVLQAVKDVAAAQRISAGRAASELIRRGLRTPDAEESLRKSIVVKNGVHMLPKRDHVVTSELVNRLRDEE